MADKLKNGFIYEAAEKAWKEISKEKLVAFLNRIVKEEKNIKKVVPLLESASYSKIYDWHGINSVLLYLLYREVIKLDELDPIIDSLKDTSSDKKVIADNVVDFLYILLLVESGQITYFKNSKDGAHTDYINGIKELGKVNGTRVKEFCRDNLVKVNLFSGKVNHTGFMDMERSLTRAVQDMKDYSENGNTNNYSTYADNSGARTPLDNLYFITAKDLIQIDNGNEDGYRSTYQDRISFLLNSGLRNRYIIDKMMIMNYGDMARDIKVASEALDTQGNPIDSLKDIMSIVKGETIFNTLEKIYNRYTFNMIIDHETGNVIEYTDTTETQLTPIGDFLNNKNEKNNELLKLLEYIRNRTIN